MPLQPGSQFDRYTIETLLGEGGMGQAYRARDSKLHRKVVLKVLRLDASDASGGSGGRARLLREARAAATLDHPNTIAIFDVGEVAGTPYIAMELVEGESLRHHVSAPAPLERRLGWLADVARALGSAHQRGLVHRDVKPENVMVRSDGVVKVLDFGIARRVDGPIAVHMATAGTVTAEGKVVGTPLYMSPEQMRGEELDGRSDQFSWGVMAWELLSGKVPWSTSDQMAMMSQILSSDPGDPPGVPPAVAAVIRKTLAKRPADRYPTMEEVAVALDALAAAHSSELGLLATVAEGTRPPARRWPILAAAGGLIVLCGAALLATRKAPAPPAISAAPPSKPVSANADAVRAYDEGRAALRGSDWVRARDRFQLALARDPECASAAVQLLLMARYLTFDQTTEVYRDLYRRADARRDRLEERESVLLDAVQPLIMRDPPDVGAMRSRLVAASDRFPQDVQAAFFAAVASEDDAEAMLRGADRVLTLDPEHLDAMQLRARSLYRLGRRDEGKRQLDACVERAPGSQCASDRVAALRNEGRCADAATAARAMVIDSAGSEEAYEYLAIALAAVEAPDASVVEAIRQSAAKAPAANAEIEEPGRLTMLDVLGGRFAAAQRRVRELATRIDRRPDAAAHERVTALLAELLRERGSAAQLAALASDFEARHQVWNRGADPDLATPVLLEALDELGVTPHEVVVRRMIKWRDEALRQTRRPLNVHACAALVARTAEEARAVLASAGPIERGIGRRELVQSTARLGHAQLVAGDAETAVETLKRATRSCSGLIDAFTDVRSHLWLGQAEEARGDTKAACAAYGFVLHAWGREKPLGRTAKTAQARRAQLGCP